MITVSQPIITNKEINNVMKTMKSGMLAQGPKVKELEEKFAKYCETKYAVAVNNGTAALHTALYAAGIREGDEVITVPFTFVATANAIIMCGAKPVFVDVNPVTFNIDTNQIIRAITKKTKAILPVNLFGRCADYKEIISIAKHYKLKIIEDACQSHGATYYGKYSGGIGDLGCFSFYATKNMMCGEGGIITTNNDSFAEQCRRFRHHGQSEKTQYEYYDLGYNYRMTDLQASIAIPQLQSLEVYTRKRILNAKLYDDNLSKYKGNKILIPNLGNGIRHVFHQYTIRVRDNIALKNYLLSKDIMTGIYYPKPLHLHRHFQRFGYKEGDFPVSEELSHQVLSLPVHPNITKDDINKVCKHIGEYLHEN